MTGCNLCPNTFTMKGTGMSNNHGTVPRNPIPAPRHPESHVVIQDIVIMVWAS